MDRLGATSVMTSALLRQSQQEMKLDETAGLLPGFLVRLSNESLTQRRNRHYDPWNHSFIDNLPEANSDEDLSVSVELTESEAEPIPIMPWNSAVSVVAIDVSSIRIGETSDGTLCALRGAVVWRKSEGYTYTRCGPLIFHLNEATINSIFQNLGISTHSSASDIPLAPRLLGRLRNALEHWIQLSICNFFEDTLILLDGSLTGGTPDNPARPIEAMLRTARANGDTVIAISKSSKLRLMGNEITKLTERIPTACVIDVDSAVRRQFPKYPVQLLGRIFVAKLLQKGFSFRLDVDLRIPRDEAVESIRKLVRSDVVSQGYPETLRLAHILSTFTANEVIGIQRFLYGRHGLRPEPPFNLRRSLFGPYGTSWEAG